MLLIIATIIVSGWLLWGIIKLSFKVAWGAAKVVAWLLSIIALPLLVILSISAGGLILFLPVGLLVMAIGLLRACWTTLIARRVSSIPEVDLEQRNKTALETPMRSQFHLLTFYNMIVHSLYGFIHFLWQ